MRIAPSFLGATTIPAHHGVGSSTFLITPIDSIHSSSVLTLGRSGIGMCLGVNSEKGVASAFRWISYGSPRLPSPLNTDGYSVLIVVCVSSIVSILTAKPRAVIAGRPSQKIGLESFDNIYSLFYCGTFPM